MHLVSKNPKVYIDVAHSPQAVKTVLDYLKSQTISLICAARNDKDIEHMQGTFHHVIAVQMEENMHQADDILAAFDAPIKQVASDIPEALKLAKDKLPEGGIILCLGGFSLCAHVLAHYQEIDPTELFTRL